MEAPLNSGRVMLLDQPKLESQLLGLVWRANKIDHANSEFDDWANAVAGAIHRISAGAIDTSQIFTVDRAIDVRNNWLSEDTGSFWGGDDPYLTGRKPDW